MKRFLPIGLTLMAIIATNSGSKAQELIEQSCECCRIVVPDSLIVSNPQALFDSLPQPEINPEILNLSLIPKVFSGYQKIHHTPSWSSKTLGYHLGAIAEPESPDVEEILTEDREIVLDSDSLPTLSETVAEEISLPSIQTYKTPQWLKDAVNTSKAQENLLYSYMIDNPLSIEYAYWDLPLPPVFLEEDKSFSAYFLRQNLPEVDPEEVMIPGVEIKKKHWLHTVGAQLQFSQAYVSPNWYQGGNNYLSLLFGFNWNVQLNQVYHPNLLFQSDLSYKMAMSSNPKGNLHRYTIAEDNFQYNLNAGLKAAKDWYYSFNLQFKTQLLNNYESDSQTQTAAFLSPGDLNIGLGMAYSRKNKVNTFQYTLTISPISYNLKTCISDKVDHATYNIEPWKKTRSEVGSNVEFVMDWKIISNISYKTRMFMFTNYQYFLADWQNTLNFEINKFLSTQIFVHLRYDGSTDSYGKWKKFMMREILSFGLSYTFSTKP